MKQCLFARHAFLKMIFICTLKYCPTVFGQSTTFPNPNIRISEWDKPFNYHRDVAVTKKLGFLFEATLGATGANR